MHAANVMCGERACESQASEWFARRLLLAPRKRGEKPPLTKIREVRKVYTFAGCDRFAKTRKIFTNDFAYRNCAAIDIYIDNHIEGCIWLSRYLLFWRSRMFMRQTVLIVRHRKRHIEQIGDNYYYYLLNYQLYYRYYYQFLKIYFQKNVTLNSFWRSTSRCASQFPFYRNGRTAFLSAVSHQRISTRIVKTLDSSRDCCNFFTMLHRRILCGRVPRKYIQASQTSQAKYDLPLPSMCLTRGGRDPPLPPSGIWLYHESGTI